MSKRKQPRTRTLYLGWDGAYVLSRYKLRKFRDGNCDYLATGKKFSCVDIGDWEGSRILGGLRLKKFEVVKLTVSAVKP